MKTRTEMNNTRPWKTGVDRHLATTSVRKFRGWIDRAGVKVLF